MTTNPSQAKTTVYMADLQARLPFQRQYTPKSLIDGLQHGYDQDNRIVFPTSCFIPRPNPSGLQIPLFAEGHTSRGTNRTEVATNMLNVLSWAIQLVPERSEKIRFFH